jgi:hypothetical protein
VLRTVLAVAVAAVLALTAHAQAPYPNRGIRFIVPYAAGGLPDTVARIVAQQLQERIGQSVVVENRAGGQPSRIWSAAKPEAPPAWRHGECDQHRGRHDEINLRHARIAQVIYTRC